MVKGCAPKIAKMTLFVLNFAVWVSFLSKINLIFIHLHLTLKEKQTAIPHSYDMPMFVMTNAPIHRKDYSMWEHHFWWAKHGFAFVVDFVF